MIQVLLFFFCEIIFKILARKSDEHFFSCPCCHRSLLVEVDHMWIKCDFVQSGLKDTCTIKRFTCIKRKIELLCNVTIAKVLFGYMKKRNGDDPCLHC